MKVVISDCRGGFCLSEAGMRAYYGRKGKDVYSRGPSLLRSYFDEPVPPQFSLAAGSNFMERSHPEYENYLKWYSAHALDDSDMPRDDQDLIAVVEQLGRASSGPYASLRVVEIPDGTGWRISEVDGSEVVAAGEVEP